MKLLLLFVLFSCIPFCVDAATAAQSPAAPQTKAEKKAEEARLKTQRKEEALQLKAEARQAKWAAEHPPAEALQPPHPASLRPEFLGVMRQASAQVDNAFNMVQASRVEFVYANSAAMQWVASVAGSAATEGEAQVAAALVSYAQMASVCRDVVETMIRTFPFSLGGDCRPEMQRRLTVLKLTFEQDK